MKVSWFNLMVAVVGLTLTPNALADIFSDGFEGASINPFWMASGPGTEALTTTASFAGSQSVEFTASSTFPWFSDLTHDFGSEQYGSVSVYALTGLLCCGSAADIQIGNTAGAGDVAVFQRTADGGFVARVNPGPNEIDHSFTSSTPSAWHQLEIISSATGLTFEFDGTTVFTDPSDTTGFRYVDLQVFGGPGGSNFFDNFSADTISAVPEPSSWALLAGVLIGLFFSAVRKAQSLRSQACAK